MRVLLLASAACVVRGAVHNILVGRVSDTGVASNIFEPPQLSAIGVGDTVRFVFNATGQRYAVVQSMPDAACTPLPGGFNTPWVAGVDDATFVIVINSSALFFYGAQTDAARSVHCLAGMFGAINAPEDAFLSYASAAAALTKAPVDSDSTSSSPSPTAAANQSESSSPSSTASLAPASETHAPSGPLPAWSIAMLAISGALGAALLLYAGWRIITRELAPPYSAPDLEGSPPPQYSAVTLVEEVGGRHIMRASTVLDANPFADPALCATLDENPFADPTSQPLSRTRDPFDGPSEEDAPPEYLSVRSIPPSFSASSL